MINFYKYLSIYTINEFFIYSIIIIISIVFFRKINIKLNIVVGLVFALLIIFYYHGKLKLKTKNAFQKLQEKSNDLKYIGEMKLYKNQRYFTLIDILYNLNDLDKFDDENFTLFMLSVKEFIELNYTFNKLLDSRNDMFYLKNNINFQIEYRNKTIEYLKTLSMTITNIEVINKIKKAMYSLNLLFNCYINDNISREPLLQNIGLNYNIKPYNFY